MLRKILKNFITNSTGLIGIETAKIILNTEPKSLQSFVLCTNQDNSKLKASIATKQAMVTVFNRRESMIEINLDYVNATKWHIDNIYNQIDKVKNDFSIIYLESTDLAFLQDKALVKQISYLAKMIRKFRIKLILSLPISSEKDLEESLNFTQNFIFIKF